ncbi:DUF6264 family protein [Microbacterium oxydans]|uniref:Uncharacterized protein n=1 Tax=Microbacterium oxydans TaxID=82380 RepID=A0A0F0L897_9MICO|nr:DUF6264 family protein [Microbacterium oxydans]KJL28525.1 hypothetical protein RS83_03599 [Microbacterium oxydans]
MTDQRPQYGELATPEEQRRAAGLPPLGELPPAPPVVQSPPSEPAEQARGLSRSRPVDRFATIGLLAYGLVNVVITSVSYLDLPTVMDQSMKIFGIDGEFSNFAQGRLWGTIAAALLVVGWALTAALSIRRLRRGKLTWWVPLVGAVITMAVVSACIAVPMFNDPAFIAYLEQMPGG